MKIRFVTKKDVFCLLKIYFQYIDTLTTFEYELPSKEEFTQRIVEISKDYPYLVLEDNNKIIGYAYAHRFQQRAAYSWNTELSIYLDKNQTGKGYGRKLYSVLIEILKLQEIRNIYALITEPNEGSKKLHKTFGFNKSGIFHKTGYKNNAWIDVELWEKQINPYSKIPREFISIKDVDKEKINKVIQEYII